MKKIILNEAFGIVALAILLVPQLAHTVYLFNANSHYDAPWWSWCYAIGVDLAIFIFTIKGWMRTAILYFFGTLAHNLMYQFYPESIWSALLIALMLSSTIFSFSHLFYYKREGANDVATHHKGGATRSQHSAEALRLASDYDAGMRFEPLPHKCPQCGKRFATTRQLNGHVSAHKSKGEWNVGDSE